MRRNNSLSILLFAVTVASAQDTWQTVWSDDFTGLAGAPPNPKNWTYDLGGGGWGNNELQTYTNSSGNSFLDGNRHLVIRAQTGDSGYTSARLKTQGLFSIAYGKIEARIKVASGQGLWSAFWMLGAGFPTVNWPEAGEIDVMEHIGKERSMVRGSVHGPGYAGAGAIGAPYALPGGQAFSDDFHVFSVVWQPEALEFFVDGRSYQKITPVNLPANSIWVFRSPFFILMNLAVGGDWPGNPDSTTIFPQAMLVDYVRVYRSSTSPIINPSGVVNAASFSNILAPGAIASLFGTGLANGTYQNLFDAGQNAFVKTADSTSVLIGGEPTPLIYVSPNQITFQVPWGKAVSTALAEVMVSRRGVLSNQVSARMAERAPGLFRTPAADAILTCQSGPDVAATECTIWGTGFGAKSVSQSDGVPATIPPFPRTTAVCTLTIGGRTANVTYCGSAPGLVIDQLNFLCPEGIPWDPRGVAATLKIDQGIEDVRLLLPKP